LLNFIGHGKVLVVELGEQTTLFKTNQSAGRSEGCANDAGDCTLFVLISVKRVLQ
jgi:hypothetical protein